MYLTQRNKQDTVVLVDAPFHHTRPSLRLLYFLVEPSFYISTVYFLCICNKMNIILLWSVLFSEQLVHVIVGGPFRQKKLIFTFDGKIE